MLGPFALPMPYVKPSNVTTPRRARPTAIVPTLIGSPARQGLHDKGPTNPSTKPFMLALAVKPLSPARIAVKVEKEAVEKLPKVPLMLIECAGAGGERGKTPMAVVRIHTQTYWRMLVEFV